MRETEYLSELWLGDKAFIIDIDMDIDTKSTMRRRLRDLGLINGTEVTCVQKSPLGDPIAYLVRGAVIALRSEESSRIKIRRSEVQYNVG